MLRQFTAAGILGITVCLLLTGNALAQEKKSAQSKENPTKENQAEMHAYLGIGVESLPPALAQQLPQLDGRGLEIAQIAKDSPAEKAGLKQYDILVSYDNQPLYAPEQLVKLVQHDKPGRPVALEVLRKGKQEKFTVTLGQHQVARTARVEPQLPRFFREESSAVARTGDKETTWETFDSMNLSRLDDKHFKATISYRDDQGTLEHKDFQGTRQEIGKAIRKEKDMPAAERDQLLRALNLRPQVLEFSFPRFSSNGRMMWDNEDLDHEIE